MERGRCGRAVAGGGSGGRSNFAELLRECFDWTGFLLGDFGAEGERVVGSREVGDEDLDSVVATGDGGRECECGTRDGCGIKGTLGGGGSCPELTWRGVKASEPVSEVCATTTILLVTASFF